jgi:hypothetical protein
MHLTICCADGTKISRPEYNAIHKSVEKIYNNFMDLVGPDPHLAMDNDHPKLPTRTIFKSLFPAEFTQAILQLRAHTTQSSVYVWLTGKLKQSSIKSSHSEAPRT